MSSGKQLSFAYGEVSPSLRFRVDGSFYAQALKTAKNGFVLKSGGFTNRAGMEYWFEPDLNVGAPRDRQNPRVRIFPFTAPNKRSLILVIKDQIDAIPDGWDPIEDGVFLDPNVISLYDAETGERILDAFGGFRGIATVVPLDLSRLQVSALGPTIQLVFRDGAELTGISALGSPFAEFRSGIQLTYIVGTPDSFALGYAEFTTPTPLGTTPTTSDIGGFANTPSAPVSYKIYQELWDGREALVLRLWNSLYHPNSYGTAAWFTLSAWPSVDDQVKQYNIYRAAGFISGGDVLASTSHALVGRVRPVETAQPFADFLPLADITQTEPEDERFYAFYDRVTYYKERTVIIPVFSAGISTRFPEGTVIVSKLGAPTMFARPLTPNPTDAFSFTIPVTSAGRITNIIAAQRLLLFTKRESIIVRGGDNGVLTALEVNPEVIAFEGCCEDVNPVSIGSTVFHLNFEKNKLMMVAFSGDDSVQSTDISVLSDHFFKPKDIIDMVAYPGQTNMVLFLKRDGTLVSLSISDQGVLAFARMDTAGRVESVCVQEVEDRWPVSVEEVYRRPAVYASVIRDGVRSLERLFERDDVIASNWAYADSHTMVGMRNVFWNAEGRYLNNRLNITTATTFEAGEILTITDVEALNFFDASITDKRIDFFYKVTDPDTDIEYLSKVRIIPTTFTDANTFEGYAEEDLPEIFRDSETQDLPDKLIYQTHWALAENTFSGLEHLAEKEVSVYADGRVYSSPLNPNRADDTLTVASDGTIELPEYINYGVIGLPYETELETLDLEASDQRTFTDVGKLINLVGIGLENTKSGFVGQTDKNLMSMEEFLTREDEFLEQPTDTFSGHLKLNIPAGWEQTGRVKIKQVDPLPMTILAVYPKGVIGD